MNDLTLLQSIVISVLTLVIAENFVFARAFGVSTMIVSAKNKRNLRGICLGIVYFTTASSAAAWMVNSALPSFSSQACFKPFLYVLLIGILYIITLLGAYLFFRSRFSRLKKYVHIAAFNGSVMGTIFLCSSSCEGAAEYILFGLCSGLGFSAASYMLSGVYSQLYSKAVPKAFRGYPSVMLFAGIIAMALYGILGHAPSFV